MARSNSRKPAARLPRNSTRTRKPAPPGSRNYLRPQRRWRRRRSECRRRRMPSASKQHPSSPSRLDSGHSFLLILVHPFPCFVAALATGIVGRLTQVSGTGGDEGGDARAEGEQPTSQGADTGVPSAARQEQRRRLGRGVSSAALVLGGTPRKFMPGAQFLHGSRLSVLGDDTEDEWPQGAHARVLA